MIAALLVLLVGAAVAIVGRDGGGTKSSSSRKTDTASPGAVTTALTPTTAPPTSATPTAPSGPASFTAQSTCGSRACSVLAVRDMPATKGGKTVGSLNTVDVVQVSCSTHGEMIRDKDTS